jgi:TonB family protein
MNKGGYTMKHGLMVLKAVLILLVFLFVTGSLWPAPDVAAQLRLYEGFKEVTAAPAGVITSYYLKPLPGGDVFLEVDILKEQESLKRVFSLKDIKLITQAGLVLGKDSAGSPFQVIILNRRELLLQLDAVAGESSRFKVAVLEVLENGKPSRSLLESKIYLPQQKTTILGFEDSTGKIYFLSFRRGEDVPSLSGAGAEKDKAVHIGSTRKPRLVKKSANFEYPKEALKAHIQGKVVIEATTNTQGQVVDAVVIEGPQELRAAALDAIKQWQYEPYMIDGKPMPVKFTVMFNFALDRKEEEQKPISLSSAQKPKLIKTVNPQYPPGALKEHVEGIVVMEAVIDTKGLVKDVTVMEGHDLLNAAAVEALKQWQYEPYLVEGAAKTVKFTVVMKFKLTAEKKDAK